MRRVLILNGPNLNLLGKRRPEIYGTTTLRELERHVREWGGRYDLGVETLQTNHEGELIDRLHGIRDAASGVVINAGALAHTSYALHDAIEAVALPTVEVHISNVKEREEWRRHSVIAPACVATIYGRGVDGYRWALRHLAMRMEWPFETIAYGSEHDQLADLRLPTTPAPHPVAMLFHGGFWRDPWQRDVMDALAVSLTREGFATWNVEYRRVGNGGGWPVTLHDVAAAVDHLSTLDHDLDLDRIIAVGHSAGGQLALWSAGRHLLGPDDPGAGPVVRPSGVVALAPIADLVAAHERSIGDGAVEGFLRRTPTDGPERYRTASPSLLSPLGIPQVIVHGGYDDIIPVDMSRDYVELATRNGDDAVLKEIGSHFDVIDPHSPVWGGVLDAIVRLAIP